MRLQDKVIIVTGSCTGIGKAIAVRCVAEGARVVIHGLEKHLGEDVVNMLGSDKAVLLIEDITNEGAPQRLVNLALKSFGRLDAVVNNAALVISSNIHTTDLAFIRNGQGQDHIKSGNPVTGNENNPFILYIINIPDLSLVIACLPWEVELHDAKIEKDFIALIALSQKIST